MTWLLIACEMALVTRLLITVEVVRRPMFTFFLLGSLYSAATYSHSGDLEALRHHFAVMTAATAALMLLTMVEALIRMTQPGHVLFTSAFSIAGAAFATRLLQNVPVKTFGPEIYWVTLGLVYLATLWTAAVGFVLLNKAVKLQGGAVRSFDLILLVYLWARAGGSLLLNTLPDGRDNPNWGWVNMAAQIVLAGCMLAWLSTKRLVSDLVHQVVAEKRRYNDQQFQDKRKVTHGHV